VLGCRGSGGGSEVVYVVGLGQRLGQSLMGYVVELGDFYCGKLVCIGGRL
jgi:hypothetical protein